MVNYLDILLLQAELPVLGDISDAVSEGLTVWQVVGISIATYLLGFLAQYIVSLLLKRADVHNNRRMKITELAIQHELSTYRSLVKLRGFQRGESSQMLSEIESLNVSLSDNKLLFSKRYHKAATDIVEYFSVVCPDFVKKDVQREKKLFDALYNSFYN